MKLASYNIQYGFGRDGVFGLERIAESLAGADLIALQEVERFWKRSRMRDEAQAIADLLGDYHWVYGAGVDLDASFRDDDERLHNRRRQFGNMLLSRRPILSSRNHLLPKYASLGPMSIQRSALEGVVETGIGLVRFYSVHLTHLAPETRLPQVEALLEVHRRAPVEGAAIAGAKVSQDWTLDGIPPALPAEAILMGDFNMEPDSEEYDRITGPVSPYGGRIINPQGFVDAWVAAGHDEGEGITAEIKGRTARLDYCFVSAVLRERIRDARIDAKAEGSDHQPIWVDIDLD